LIHSPDGVIHSPAEIMAAADDGHRIGVRSPPAVHALNEACENIVGIAYSLFARHSADAAKAAAP
jgi:hypothetical protein